MLSVNPFVCFGQQSPASFPLAVRIFFEQRVHRGMERGHFCPMPLGFDPMPFGYSVRGHCPTERRKDRWSCNPKGIVSSSPATESARLPWVGVRAIFNPNGVVFRLRHRATTPLGLADTTRFSQGSSRLATLGFGAESLWDSSDISARLAQILAALDILVRFGVDHPCVADFDGISARII